MNKKVNNTNQRAKLAQKLQWGDKSKIAKVARVDRRTVERYFNGESDNVTVDQVAKKLFKQREENIDLDLASIL